VKSAPGNHEQQTDEQEDQAVELYWIDVNFRDYASNSLTFAAAAEFSSLKSFTGPRSGDRVTPQTLFRGFTARDVIGPYVSQFLLKPFNYGPCAMSGTMRMYVPGVDYMTDQTSWLNVQNGVGPFGSNQFERVPRLVSQRPWLVMRETTATPVPGEISPSMCTPLERRSADIVLQCRDLAL